MWSRIVLDQLDEGSWAIAQNARVRYNAQHLANRTREVVLTYRSHRLREISGASSARVDVIATVRHLLRSAPGEALCDSCLAFAYAMSVTEMHMWTEVLLQIEHQFQRASTCASCGHTAPSIVYK